MLKFITFTILTILGLNSYALSGLEIMQKVEDRDDGQSMKSIMTMVLIDKNNKKRIRKMQTYSIDIDKNTEHRAIFFLSPTDVRRTAFLTFDYKEENKDDDQWMFLPALKKTKRIPSSDKDGSFMGSDFSYADMTDRIVNDYSYKILKESNIKRKNGVVKVWQIESIPKSQKTIDETGYTKSIAFVRQDNFMVVRAKMYLKKTGKVKYMDVRKIEKINNIWVAIQTSMTTKFGKQTMHKTLLTQSDITINTEIDKDIFTIRSIEKGL